MTSQSCSHVKSRRSIVIQTFYFLSECGMAATWWTCLEKVESFPWMKGELDDETVGFTQEFEDEAVRLARTSGRTRRELAENLGVGRSTLTR
jgi:hypothetical protein